MLLRFFLSLSLFMLFNLPAAWADEPFQLSCDKVEKILIALTVDTRGAEVDWDNPELAIGCQVELASGAGDEFEELRVKRGGEPLLIHAGKTFIAEYDSNVRSIPPRVFFHGDGWEEVRVKLMAICPEKIPEDIPRRVLDHKHE